MITGGGKLILQTGSTTGAIAVTTYNHVGTGVTDPISRLSLLSDYNDPATEFSIDARVGTSTYNLRLYPLLEAAGQVGYNFRVRNLANVFDVLILAFDNIEFINHQKLLVVIMKMMEN
jgi:hypothetical protein